MSTTKQVDATADSLPTEVPKARKCLLCKNSFDSAWAGERICKRCKSSATWKSCSFR